jgi:hypothetical protein
MALFGWANPQQAAVYTKKANRAKLESQAALLLQGQNRNNDLTSPVPAPLKGTKQQQSVTFSSGGVRWDKQVKKALTINGVFR